MNCEDVKTDKLIVILEKIKQEEEKFKQELREKYFDKNN